MTTPAPKRARKAAPKKRRKVPSKPKAPKRGEPSPKVDAPAPRRSKVKPPILTELSPPVKPVEEVKPSIDWIAVKLRYVRGFVPEGAPASMQVKWESLADLAAAFNVSIRAVETHCSSEGWVDERLEYQAKLGTRLKDETTKLLSIRQARTRETIHTGAQFLVQKVLEKAQREQVSMSDLVGGITSLHRALKTTSEAADPDVGKVTLATGLGGRWLLIRDGLDPEEDADVLDVLPEEDPVE